jgi:hypothetical protein
MTVLSTQSSQSFDGSGNTGPFTWTWRFLVNGDITVKKNRATMALVEGVDYVLTGAGSYTGGSLTLTVALEEGETLDVERNTAATQDTKLRSQGDFFPETYEDALDRQAMISQDRERRIAAIEDRGYTFTIQQASATGITFVELPTELGNVVAELPAAGTVNIIKDGLDAYTIDFIVSVVGQTIDAYGPLSVDGEFIQWTLFGTRWRRTA